MISDASSSSCITKHSITLQSECFTFDDVAVFPRLWRSYAPAGCLPQRRPSVCLLSCRRPGVLRWRRCISDPHSPTRRSACSYVVGLPRNRSRRGRCVGSADGHRLTAAEPSTRRPTGAEGCRSATARPARRHQGPDCCRRATRIASSDVAAWVSWQSRDSV